MVRFQDAAKRHGIAFQYTISYLNEWGIPDQAPGLGVLHQLHADRPDVWVWVENQHPRIKIEEGEISILTPKPDFVTKEPFIANRHFLFLYNYKGALGPACPVHLSWLQKFSDGQECGWLYPGKEAEGADVPKVSLAGHASERSYFPFIDKLLRRHKENF